VLSKLAEVLLRKRENITAALETTVFVYAYSCFSVLWAQLPELNDMNYIKINQIPKSFGYVD